MERDGTSAKILQCEEIESQLLLLNPLPRITYQPAPAQVQSLRLQLEARGVVSSIVSNPLNPI